MVDTLGPADAVAGAPLYSGRKLRQLASTALAGATSARPLGARSGVRPGTPSTTVTATATVWTVQPFSGIADVMTAAEAGPYEFAFDAVATGAVTAAAGTARKDIIYVEVKDPAEGIGAAPSVTRRYLAGVAGSGVAPSIPVGERGFVIAEIAVPASGGGAPTVSWVAPYAAAAGAIIPFSTKAQMDATAASLPTGTYGDVFADPTSSNNGLYKLAAGAWGSVSGAASAWTPVTPESSYYNVVPYSTGAGVAAHSWQALSVKRASGLGFLEGHISTDGNTGNDSTWAYVPAGYRPPVDWPIMIRPTGSGTTFFFAGIVKASDGSIIVRPNITTGAANCVVAACWPLV